MEVGKQLGYVREFREHRGTRGQCKKPTVSWRLRKHTEEMLLHLADMAFAAQVVPHGLVLPSCAALIRPLHIKRPSNGENLTRIRRKSNPPFAWLVTISRRCHMFCAECEVIATEIGEETGRPELD